MKVAFSIPHTRHNLKFIGEVHAALDEKGIVYEAEVDVDYEGQQPFVQFKCNDVDVDQACDIVEYVSKNPKKESKS